MKISYRVPGIPCPQFGRHVSHLLHIEPACRFNFPVTFIETLFVVWAKPNGLPYQAIANETPSVSNQTGFKVNARPTNDITKPFSKTHNSEGAVGCLIDEDRMKFGIAKIDPFSNV
jgi:hypothetical protein